MENAQGCTCSTNGPARLIFACSGGSNVGQISNQAAIEISRAGFGKFYCLAGLGGDVPVMLETAKAADERIVIDGCPVQCARKVMERTGLPIDRYVLITDLGIKKVPDLVVPGADVEKVVRAVLREG
jgi:uncharacterized metal-binding protein